MYTPLNIRPYQPGEESALYAVHYSAIHLVARRDYTAEQIRAWAPYDTNMCQWANRIRAINPFVAELAGELVGYADLQSSGYIDHFFVSGKHPGQGIGTRLMQHLFQEAKARGITELTSNVSRTAQPFFEGFGFEVVEQHLPERRGVVIPNALMRWSLPQDIAPEHDALRAAQPGQRSDPTPEPFDTPHGAHMHWFLLALKKYATFSGRARRSEYWYFVLFYLIIFFALSIIDGITGSFSAASGMGFLGGLLTLGLLLPSIAVGVRRLHDTGRSGWWLLLAVIPIVGAIVLLVFFAQDSAAGDNAHGPNPKTSFA
ncbi:MAG: hypothetical protein ABT02_07115 [Comamonadaceae bacterium SCN 68-20]|nr:MAG: hypothetical protein ABT02_07115 [Comamonadaceae bacterium SCN 68-20]OJX05682.1 MAG: hypothetical protein BGO75_16035 [Burkholderiales bacterium 68-20]